MAGYPRPLEKDVSKPILQWLGLEGLTIHRRNVGVMKRTDKGKTRYVAFGERSQADYWFIWPENGRHCELELKRPGEKPTDKQMIWLTSVNLQGGFAFWADDLSTVHFAIDSLVSGHTRVFFNFDKSFAFMKPEHYGTVHVKQFEYMQNLVCSQKYIIRSRGRGRKERRR